MSNFVTEKNISDQDRTWKQVCGVIKSYCSSCDPDTCTFTKTPKGNWKVECDGKKICIISKFILPDEMAIILGLADPRADEQ